MPVYRISELQSYLSSLNRGSKRTLSQNFLIDGNIVQKILSFVSCTAGDVVIEIGPGPGALTEGLLQKGLSVIAIELDDDFAATLGRLQSQMTGSLQVFNEDVLAVSFPDIQKKYLPKNQPIHIVSNMPYHLTKEILQKIGKTCPHPFEAILMVQEEVARKVTSPSPQSSLMTLELSLFGSFSYLASIPKGCFFPKPKVDSALISYVSHPPMIESSLILEQFIGCLSKVYQHRRKALVGLLEKESFVSREIIETWLIQKGFSKTARPDELTLPLWIDLFHHIRQFSNT
jgi:16S rRNA (adenine1518-N6/adenine1519-N6)-dimethyltransferase